MTSILQHDAVRFILVVFCVLAGLPFLPTSYAHAEGKPTAVFDVIAEGADDQLATQITAVLKREAAKNPEFDLVEQEDIALLETLIMFDCDEPSDECMTQLGHSLNAKRLIYGRLIAKGDLYDIQVKVFDVEKSSVAKRWNKRFTANADALGFFVREMEVFIGGRTQAEPTRLRVSANIENASVLIDGKRVGRTPYVNEDITVGTHEIVVEKEGHTSWTHTVDAKAGAELVLRADLTPGATNWAEGGKGGERPELDDDGLRLATYGWVTVGLGTASLITGTVFAVLMQQTQTDFNDTPYQNEGIDLAEKGDSQATAANIFFGAGAAAIITGAILILADKSEARAGASVAVPNTGSRVRFAPALGPDRAGLSLDLRF